MSDAEKRKLFDYAIKLLLASSIAELLLNRIFSRVGIFIPRDELFISAYTFLSQLGVLALNFSSLLLFFALFKIADEKLRLGGRINPAIATLIFFVLLLSIAFIFVAPDAVLSIVYSGASLLALLLIAYNPLSGGERTEKRAVAAILAAYLCSYYYKLSNFTFQALGSAEAASLAVELFALGEVIALAASALIFLAYRGEANKKAFALAVFLSLIFLAATLIAPRMVAIIVIWSLGYTLFLPHYFYALAVLLFSYVVLRLLSQGKYEGYALAFIFIAGYQISLSYNQLLLLLGFALLARKNGHSR